MNSFKSKKSEKKSIVVELFKNPIFWLASWVSAILLLTILNFLAYKDYYEPLDNFFVFFQIALSFWGGLYIVIYMLITALVSWITNSRVQDLGHFFTQLLVVISAIFWGPAIIAAIYMRKSNNRKWIIRIGIALLILTILSFVGCTIAIYSLVSLVPLK